MTIANKLAIGTAVTVRRGPPEPHCRTPYYLRGQSGTIIADLGRFRNPSLLAFHKPGLPTRRLYRVQFDRRNVWKEDIRTADKIIADLYEHWLEPIGTAIPHQEVVAHA